MKYSLRNLEAVKQMYGITEYQAKLFLETLPEDQAPIVEEVTNAYEIFLEMPDGQKFISEFREKCSIEMKKAERKMKNEAYMNRQKQDIFDKAITLDKNELEVEIDKTNSVEKPTEQKIKNILRENMLKTPSKYDIN